jgi:hypothetical protein
MKAPRAKTLRGMKAPGKLPRTPGAPKSPGRTAKVPSMPFPTLKRGK